MALKIVNICSERSILSQKIELVFSQKNMKETKNLQYKHCVERPTFRGSNKNSVQIWASEDIKECCSKACSAELFSFAPRHNDFTVSLPPRWLPFHRLMAIYDLQYTYGTGWKEKSSPNGYFDEPGEKVEKCWRGTKREVKLEEGSDKHRCPQARTTTILCPENWFIRDVGGRRWIDAYECDREQTHCLWYDKEQGGEACWLSKWIGGDDGLMKTLMVRRGRSNRV